MPRNKQREKSERLKGKIIVGIDPAKDKHQLCVLDSSGCKVGKTFSIRHTHKGFTETLWKQLKKRLSDDELQQLVFSIETSADLWQGLAFYLTANGCEVVLVSPLTTYHSRALPGHDYSRTDPKDAWLIGDAARNGYYDEFKDLPAEIKVLKALSLTYDKLRKDLSRNKSRLRSWLHRYFPEFLKVLSLDTDTAKYLLECYFLPRHFLQMDIHQESMAIMKISKQQHGVETLLKLSKLAEHSIGILRTEVEEVADRLTIRAWLKEIETATSLMAEIKQELIALVKGNPAFSILKNIKGISDLTAGLFIAETNGLKGFTHYKQVQKRAGLNLRLKQSGRYKGAHRISKIGNSRLRWIIFMMTKETIRYIPEVRIKFLRRQLKRPNYIKNLIASTPQLLQLIMALVRDNRQYEYRKENITLLDTLEKAYQDKQKRRYRPLAA